MNISPKQLKRSKSEVVNNGMCEDLQSNNTTEKASKILADADSATLCQAEEMMPASEIVTEECKLTVNKCEKILIKEPDNVEANLRMSQAMLVMSRGRSVQQLNTSLKFARIASQSSSNSEVLSHLEYVEKALADLPTVPSLVKQKSSAMHPLDAEISRLEKELMKEGQPLKCEEAHDKILTDTDSDDELNRKALGAFEQQPSTTVSQSSNLKLLHMQKSTSTPANFLAQMRSQVSSVSEENNRMEDTPTTISGFSTKLTSLRIKEKEAEEAFELAEEAERKKSEEEQAEKEKTAAEAAAKKAASRAKIAAEKKLKEQQDAQGTDLSTYGLLLLLLVLFIAVFSQ